MSSPITAHADLFAVIGDRPALRRLTEFVLVAWPEHADYLRKSYAARTKVLLDTSDTMADAVLKLAGDRAAKIAEDYRWLCDQIREEEINFARTDLYRYSTFEQTNANVYSNDDFMERYMHGLLYSHVLWYMHISSLHFFAGRLAARVKPGGSVLEVGSGHGLLIYLALSRLELSSATAWDLSPVSLNQTKEALSKLGMAGKARFGIQDMHKVEAGTEQHNLIILSHLLEHLEDPADALRKMRNVVAKDGYLFVNVPLNAPMPDHLVLLREPEEAMKLLTEGGFRVLEIASHTTQAVPLAKALKRKIAVTCSIIAEPA